MPSQNEQHPELYECELPLRYQRDPSKAKGRQKVYRRPRNATIKFIDFGGATFANEYHSSIISTRQYRAPEVLMETGWNELADVFSFGAILLELYTGINLLSETERSHGCILSLISEV